MTIKSNAFPYIIIICLFLAVAIWLSSVSPKYEILKSLRIKKEQKKTELSSKKEYLNHLEKIQTKMKKHEQPLAKIETALPSNPFLPSIFNFLQKASSQNGLVLRGISSSSGSVKEKKEIQEISINISLAGSYSAFKSFLSVLEKSSRLFVIDSISFSSPSKEDAPFHFSLAIKIFSY